MKTIYLTQAQQSDLTKIIETLGRAAEWLECDGLTRVGSHLLSEAGIAHLTYYGTISLDGEGAAITPHYWIHLSPYIDGLQNHILDFAARRWFSHCPSQEEVSEGLFDHEKAPQTYRGSRCILDPMSPTILGILLTDPYELQYITESV
jgi:hypothetical protein